MEELESATVVYVGRGEETLLGVVHSLPSNKVLHWENNSLIPVGLAVTKLLMRRYFLVEKTKDASRIGLLVGTLGSQQCTEMLEKLRKVTLSLSFTFITHFYFRFTFPFITSLICISTMVLFSHVVYFYFYFLKVNFNFHFHFHFYDYSAPFPALI